MQPYVFPYIGYFNLINSAEKIIFYDDVNFIRQGWINRNRILVNGQPFLFSIPVRGASSFKPIMTTLLVQDNHWRRKFLAQIDGAYRSAPNFRQVFPLIESVINSNAGNISELAIQSLVKVCDYAGISLTWDKSSVVSPHTNGLEKSDRLIQITLDAGFSSYINPAGGKELYDKSHFHQSGVALHFIEPKLIAYPQYHYPFVPGLSIIDVLMFCDKEEVIKQMESYELD